MFMSKWLWYDGWCDAMPIGEYVACDDSDVRLESVPPEADSVDEAVAGSS